MQLLLRIVIILIILCIFRKNIYICILNYKCGDIISMTIVFFVLA